MHCGQGAIRTSKLKGIKLSGRLDGTVVDNWTGGGTNTLRISSDLNLRSLANAEAKPSAHVLPVDGSIHATYDGRGDTIAFRQTTLRVSSTTLALQGEVSKHSNLQVEANAVDLNQLSALTSALSPAHSTAM